MRDAAESGIEVGRPRLRPKEKARKSDRKPSEDSTPIHMEPAFVERDLAVSNDRSQPLPRVQQHALPPLNPLPTVQDLPEVEALDAMEAAASKRKDIVQAKMKQMLEAEGKKANGGKKRR